MLPESANIPDTNPNIGRRTFLLGLAGAGLTVALSSCGIDKPTTPANTLPTYTPSSASDGPNKTAQATAGESLAASDNPDLNLLAPYEVQLGQRLPEAMSFLKMPTDETSAAELAERTANFARDCAAAGVSPRFVMEPVNAEGEGIDLNKIIDATHTDALRNYLQNLKEQGVTGEQLGTFIPLPEPSVPEEWNGSNDAGLFRRNFTAVASTIKDVFPNTQICMMLDSASFPSGDWGARTYEAGPLLAYTSDIPNGLVDEFGLQGFPRASGSTDPHQLIQHSVTLQAAARLGAKRIWINTGTYSTEYNPDSQQNVPATLEARVAFLQAIGQEVAAMRQTNIPVRVNVFAADKLAHGEANWHYGQDELAAAVKPLAQQLQESGASLAVFDQRS